MTWHFVGTSSLAGSTDASRAREILAQPASRAVVRTALDKLARAPGVWLSLAAATNAPAAALMRPWFESMLAAESWGAYQVGADGGLALVAAVQVSAERSGELEAKWVAWANAVGGTSPVEVKVGGGTAREVRAANATGWSRVARLGAWTLIGWGRGSEQAFSELAARVGAGTAAQEWLAVKLNGGAVGRLLGWSSTTPWPDLALHWTGRGPIVRTTARMSYARPLDLKIEPWRLPQHTAGDPVVSFTVVQGIRSWLSQQPWWRGLGLSSTPNQAVAWTVSEIPFASYVAWESPGVTNSLNQFHPRASAFLSNNVPRIRHGSVAYKTNSSRLAWVGLPVAEPFLSPAAEGDPDFMLAGLFPLIKAKRPLPPELLAQINNRTNLVYYDWELTAQRVNGWRHVKNLYRFLAGYVSVPTNSTGEAWLSDTNVLDRLGNTGTELILASPREMEGVRNSALGLTGFELVALMRWLDDPAFPSLSEPPTNPVALRRSGASPPPGSDGSGKPTRPAVPPAPRAPRAPVKAPTR